MDEQTKKALNEGWIRALRDQVRKSTVEQPVLYAPTPWDPSAYKSSIDSITPSSDRGVCVIVLTDGGSFE